MMNDFGSGGDPIVPIDEHGNATDGSANRENPAIFDITNLSLTPKQPLYIFGSTYVEVLDVSGIAYGLEALELGGSYSPVLGAPIKVLNAGIRYTKIDDNHYTGLINQNIFNFPLVLQDKRK
jgi:hypothetical protein